MNRDSTRRHSSTLWRARFHQPRRDRERGASRSQRRSAPRLGVEHLEGRTLLSGMLFSPANWMEQGPGPIEPRTIEVFNRTFTNVEQVGAIETIAVDPSNANRVFVGTVNGGVWRTENATSLTPTWTPLTDQLPSLSISALAISPLDSNTVFAGTGSFSSAGCSGAPMAAIP